MNRLFGLFLVTLALSACGDGSATSGGTEYVPPGRAVVGDPCADNGTFAGACVRLEDTCPGGGIRPAILRCDQHRWTCVQNDALGGCTIPSTCDPSTGSVGTTCIVTGLTCSNGMPATGTTVCMGSAWTCASNADTCHTDGGLTDASADASVATVLTVAPLNWEPATVNAGQVNAPVYGTEFIATRPLEIELPNFRVELISGQLHDAVNRPSFTNARVENADNHTILAGPVSVTVNAIGQIEPIHFPPFHAGTGRSLRTAIVVDVRGDLTPSETGSQFRIVSDSGNTDRFFAPGRVISNGTPIPHEAIVGDTPLAGGIMTLANPTVRVLLGDQVISHTTVRTSIQNPTVDIEVHNDYGFRVNFRQAQLFGVLDTGRGFMSTGVDGSIGGCVLTHGGTRLSTQQTPNAAGWVSYSEFSARIEAHDVEHFVLMCQTSAFVQNATAGDHVAFGLRDGGGVWFTDDVGNAVRTSIAPDLQRQLTAPSVVLTIARHGSLEAQYTPLSSFSTVGGSGVAETVIDAQLRTTMEPGTMDRLAARIIGANRCVDSLSVATGDMTISDWIPVSMGDARPVLIGTRQLLIGDGWTNVRVNARFRPTGTGIDDCHRGDVVVFEISRGSIPGSSIFDAYNTASDFYVFGNTSGDALIPSGTFHTGAVVTVL